MEWIIYSLRIWHPKLDGGWEIRRDRDKDEIEKAAVLFSELGFEVAVRKETSTSTSREELVQSTLNTGEVYKIKKEKRNNV